MQEFEAALIDKLRAADHSDIVDVSRASEADRPIGAHQGEVELASGAKALVMTAHRSEDVSRHFDL